MSLSKISGTEGADGSKAMLGNGGRDVEEQVLQGPLGGHVLMIRGAESIAGVPVFVRKADKPKGSAFCGVKDLITLWEGLFSFLDAAKGVGCPWRLWWRCDLKSFVGELVEEESRRSRRGRAAGVEWEAPEGGVMCQGAVNDVWPVFVNVTKQDRWHGGR